MILYKILAVVNFIEYSENEVIFCRNEEIYSENSKKLIS